jgi:hypothetical protein
MTLSGFYTKTPKSHPLPVSGIRGFGVRVLCRLNLNNPPPADCVKTLENLQ